MLKAMIEFMETDLKRKSLHVEELKMLLSNERQQFELKREQRDEMQKQEIPMLRFPVAAPLPPSLSRSFENGYVWSHSHTCNCSDCFRRHKMSNYRSNNYSNHIRNDWNKYNSWNNFDFNNNNNSSNNNNMNNGNNSNNNNRNNNNSNINNSNDNIINNSFYSMPMPQQPLAQSSSFGNNMEQLVARRRMRESQMEKSKVWEKRQSSEVTLDTNTNNINCNWNRMRYNMSNSNNDNHKSSNTSLIFTGAAGFNSTTLEASSLLMPSLSDGNSNSNSPEMNEFSCNSAMYDIANEGRNSNSSNDNSINNSSFGDRMGSNRMGSNGDDSSNSSSSRFDGNNGNYNQFDGISNNRNDLQNGFETASTFFSNELPRISSFATTAAVPTAAVSDGNRLRNASIVSYGAMPGSIRNETSTLISEMNNSIININDNNNNNNNNTVEELEDFDLCGRMMTPACSVMNSNFVTDNNDSGFA